MSKPLRKKHLTPLCTRIDDIASQEVTTRMDLGRIMDMLADQGDRLSRIREELQAKRTLAVDLERVETLLNGVKTALERMGGNVMPSLIVAARAGATVGELSDVFRVVFGEFREPDPW